MTSAPTSPRAASPPATRLTALRSTGSKPSAVLATALALAIGLPAAGAEGGAAREVLPSGAGPQRLELDAAALSASARPDLGDLRLLDGAGREVPYLLVAPAAPAGRWVGGRLSSIAPTRLASGFEADLGAVREVERLRLSGLPEPFLKRVRLEGSGDRVRWTVLVEEATLFALPAEQLRLTELAFPRAPVRWLRLTWDDRASARAPLPAAADAFLPEPAPPSPAPRRVPLALERRPSEPGWSRFGLTLPGARLPVAAVILEVAGGHLHRPAEVLEARLGAAGLSPTSLGSARLTRVVQGELGAEQLRIPVAAPEERELELAVDDGDGGPLQLTAAFAELQPLPWLYFEAPGDGALTLQAGDPARSPPRYDLEAVRPRLGSLRPAAARLGIPAPATASGGPSAPPPDAPGAPLDASAFRFRRTVAALPRPGLAAVRLDAAVLGRSRGLADVRLVGPDGRQVPYLLESRQEPLEVPLGAPVREPAGARPGTTRWSLALPEPALPASRLVLATSSRLFDRRVRVVEERPQAEGGPRTLAEGSWRHTDGGRAAPELTLALPEVRGARLLLEVDDGDNAALPLLAARLLLPGWRLRFVHPGPELALVHGADGVEAPRYDLALLAPRLRAAPAAEVALGPAAPPPAPPRIQPATVAWGALVLGVAAMLWLLVRLMKPRQG
jgi:hypothetical protein